MSNNNILDPNEQNRQLLARLWDGLKRKGDGKCYCPCSQCRGFKSRRINITASRKHCREHGHAKGWEWISSICRFSIIKFFIIFFALVNVCIILIFPILTYIYWCLHVIIKEIHPTSYCPKEVTSEHVLEEHGAMNNGEQVKIILKKMIILIT